ncbi:hypothetical protein SAMD00019534_097980 [Acytostelium subglobosum LB1]|uniref:hypothetical protein n=1 Tax=Acytostelium subglobosum LB1 TaxID=1410327 RepID=UPI0006451F40|nr:hypothetical protein SAMD00019534_097980 [Acytostelium subglobosum LB1]GAM26623.1 hypothetical protein SAMD00019534_097980 [Acytostelium subglobosum LB1]|eukprot:XP_012750284.1 hypothetical protein SAMD00019534_097980 [Acytostelium subglobosum LB1]
MNLKEEYQQARQWVNDNITKHHYYDEVISVFETNIRVIGGFLTSYELTHDQLYLDEAELLANRLLESWTLDIFPNSRLNLNNSLTLEATCFILSEIGTMFLEFTHLSILTGISTYAQKVELIRESLQTRLTPYPGLLPTMLSPTYYCCNIFSIGANGDSYYEYLLKMWIYTGKKNDNYRKMYLDATNSILNNMYKVSSLGEAYITNIENGNLTHKMEHLMCFVGGMFALGAQVNITMDQRMNDLHWKAAVELTKTCANSYIKTKSGLGPETFEFTKDGRQLPTAPNFIQRPETVESIFILYRFTGDPMYQDWGWQIFKAIEQHCRVETGYVGLKDTNNPSKKDDLQQSFFMAETLKYLYLLFEDSEMIPLDKYVFNTEAHPLPILNDQQVKEYFEMISKNQTKIIAKS